MIKLKATHRQRQTLLNSELVCLNSELRRLCLAKLRCGMESHITRKHKRDSDSYALLLLSCPCRILLQESLCLVCLIAIYLSKNIAN